MGETSLSLDPTPYFGGASDLLKYGPIGLAALMLLLAIFALLARELTPPRERTMRLFMYIGAACFALAAALNFFSIDSVHTVHFRIDPLDQASTSGFPPPKITINSASLTPPMKYDVKSEVTAIVDVSDAIDSVRSIKGTLFEQNGRMHQIDRRVEDALGQLAAALTSFEESSRLAVANGCSGGTRGVPSQYAGQISQLNSTISARLSGVQTNLSTISDKLIPNGGDPQ
ncbi:hypothetical protein [Rhizobium leguminosarum]|uniref:hypothetical protein n=1 Tax=Rhizobium leguminosarum TaxID=384 RepID=UPI0004A3E74F|nr:hypothetical protein [Rhizobium leguminosarum]